MNVALRGVAVVLAALFLLAGGMKLARPKEKHAREGHTGSRKEVR
ncbi:hypothetical protein [Nonomuraea sp. NPDC005650]